MTASTRIKFPGIASSAFEHPADRAALEAVKQIPLLDQVFRKLLELGYERIMRIQFMGGGVHVSPRQCKPVYKLFREACEILDMHEPDLYIVNHPIPNAFTSGVERPFIVVHSGLINLMDEEELFGVLGHELGHVKAGHVLYKTIAYFLANVAFKFFPMGQVGVYALMIALYEWSRKSELTADRAELLVTQNLDASLRINMKLAGGTREVYTQMDQNEFLRQADAYEELDHSTLNKVFKFLREIWLTHPVPVYRAKEVKTWSESRQYSEILAGRYPTTENESKLRPCPHCGANISPSFFFCPDCGKNARV